MSYRADKQVIDTHTHRHADRWTDTQTQAMTIPEGQNWPRIKKKLCIAPMRGVSNVNAVENIAVFISCSLVKKKTDGSGPILL